MCVCVFVCEACFLGLNPGEIDFFPIPQGDNLYMHVDSFM